MNMRNLRTTLLISGALAAVLTFAGCASDSGSNQGMEGMDHGSSSAPATEASFNSADVMFAQMMIPHHEQAVEMSDVLLAKDGVDQQVIDLAQQIKDAQQPEIDQLREWLTAWGEDESGMSGMDHSMDGMMSEDDMAVLEQASGADAARLFLQQMVVHHEGAITMAQTEVDEGENPDAKAMAEEIVATQSDEIATMQDLLANL
jgi:uncharacterized protein (DUF305 family)